MSTRILRTFNELKSNSQTGLITYLTAGFPNQDLCLDIINELSESGSDLIEIGMPFSDPMAEGPIIQQSSKIALDNGHTMELIFDLIKKFRTKNTKETKTENLRISKSNEIKPEIKKVKKQETEKREFKFIKINLSL